MQVLQRRWDRTFSDHSCGFRPGRSAHQAVAQAQQYIADGHGWCIDLDLEKFFDRVKHDQRMGQIAKRVEDKRLLKLIRAFLNAGVMENGLVNPSVEGTPQGGPLSPLLGNLVLDELDRELERRGHRSHYGSTPPLPTCLHNAFPNAFAPSNTWRGVESASYHYVDSLHTTQAEADGLVDD